jgi:hypothetical protein
MPDGKLLSLSTLTVPADTGDELALFEAGMSAVKRSKDMGRLTQNLKAAGIDPKDIDFVPYLSSIGIVQVAALRTM